MSAPVPVPPQLLVGEEDPALGPLLRQVLVEMGYASTLASSLEHALHLLHAQPFDLIVTDTFSHTSQEALASLLPLMALSHPLPVILCTAWLLTEPVVKQAGFAALVQLPCHLEDLVTTVAQCLNQPWSPAQLRQAEVVKRFIACLIQREVEGFLALCTEDVRFYPWVVPAYPFARPVMGQAAARVHLQERAHYFGALQVEQEHLYPCPHGVVGRLLLHWQDPSGALQEQIVAGCVKVTPDGQISQVGLPQTDERLLGRFSALRCP